MKIYSMLIIAIFMARLLFAQSVPSLYTDIKAHEVGDVLSVIIVETANASRESKTNSSTRSGFDIEAGSSGNLANFLPMFGGSSAMSSNTDDTDGTAQKERLTGRITVRIVEKTAGGIYRIEGERNLGVNGETNLMKLSGFVRGRDISANNTIYSYSIADAKITYRKSGITNRFFKPGTISKLFTYALGALMVAAGAGYFAFN